MDPAVLKNIGCEFCIIGHSERRNLFGEKDKVIIKKVSNCLKDEIVPILCIGVDLKLIRSADFAFCFSILFAANNDFYLRTLIDLT